MQRVLEPPDIALDGGFMIPGGQNYQQEFSYS